MAETAITFNAYNDDPTILLEQEQADRFDTIAASLGDLTLPELVTAQ